MRRSRRFGARVTGSGADAFRSARRRLTLTYVAILTAVVALLSASLYEFHAHDIGRIEPRRTRTVVVPGTTGERPSLDGLDRDPASLAEYLESLGRSIILADVITILVGGVLSAVLADRTLRPIRRAVDAEKTFYANAAHDLRTPLAVMRTEAEVALRSGSFSETETRALITSSLEEIGSMSAMVEQMLDLARSGRPRRAGAMVALDLRALAREAVQRMTARAEGLGLSLRVEDAEEAPVRGDALSLQRALGNVVENALAYTPRGGSVVVRVRRGGGHVELSVEDTGIGIPAEDLRRITEPFFRGDRARGAHTGGAGLGLTIVRSTMEDHGGTVRAAQRDGGGTVITLRFPAARAPLPA
jgi:two-component system, OmpR family, sensor histidine kinase CiaH